ncbi:hypothetical protein V5O48_013602 [Marasmius crinis-equi]|uniref:Uncharacterized protein n=1 Tax=Marasmius crinis-equi TaxID=585013 RepID=A0ABR3EZM9_9AGAR
MSSSVNKNFGSTQYNNNQGGTQYNFDANVGPVTVNNAGTPESVLEKLTPHEPEEASLRTWDSGLKGTEEMVMPSG